jgi:tetratricopeptide (TPR) repeat protein
MDEKSHLDDLITRWHELRQQGQTPSAEELCADCPERLDDLKQHLRDLASMQAFLHVSQEGAAQESSYPGHDQTTVSYSGSRGATPSTPPLPGGVPGYELLGELGRGGMGVVYRARQVRLKRLVALKMVLAGSHAGPEQLTRFRVEAEAVARLQHANIVQIHEVGEQDGLPFFSMEYVAGDSLARRLKDGPLPQQEAARLTETLARAVQHAHQRGVVHRDLKPPNILLTEEGTPKITDFGLAKQLETEDGAQTRSGAVMGTPSYMAPEQAEGKTAQLGPLVDVYALGAILYELLTGRPPFRGATVMETLHQVMHDEVPPPSRYQPKIDRDLETICLKALAKDPARRYASALALAQDLERYLAGEPILARRAGMWSRAWRQVRRRPWAAGVVLTLLLAAGGIALGFRAVNGVQRRAEYARQFDDGLPESAWTVERGEQLERVLAAWQALDPEPAAVARRRLYDRFASLFRTSLRQPRLEPEDLSRLDADLEWLATRDAGLGQTLRDELRQRVRAWQPRFDLSAPWKEETDVFAPGQVLAKEKVLVTAAPEGSPTLVRTRIASQGRVQLEATFEDAWQDSSRVGLLLNVSPDPQQGNHGYAFLLVVAPTPATGTEHHPTAKPATKSFRAAGGAEMQILRSGVVLRRQPVAMPRGPLTLSVRREEDRLQFQLNAGEPVTFFDAVPLRPTPADVFGLDWPAGVGVQRLRATAQTLSETASPLERGDQLYDEARYSEALALYQEQALAARATEVGREARFKAALCLAQLNRLDEAAALLEPLSVEGEGRWTLLAACHLWVLRLEQQRVEETGALFASIRARFRPEELATFVPETVKQRFGALGALPRSELLFPTAKTLPRLEEFVGLADLVGDLNTRCGARCNLAQAYFLAGDEARALPVAREALPLALQTLRAEAHSIDTTFWAGRLYAWLMRRQGQARDGLVELDRYLAEFASILRQHFPDDPKKQQGFAPLLLDRARLYAALKDWGQAEKEIDAFLLLTPDPVSNYNYYVSGWVMKGFLCERRGATVEAQRAWKEGLYSSYLHKLPDSVRPGASLPPLSEGLVLHGVLASFTNDLSDEAAVALWNGLAEVLAGNALATQVGGLVHPSPAVLRGMWRTPRAREGARQMVFLDLSLAEYLRLPVLAGVTEAFHLDALGDQTTPEQDELLWQTTQVCLDRFFQGKLAPGQVLQLALTWKGQTNFLGWAGVAPGLEPALRGPLAYILGHRYLRLPGERRPEALGFFRMALKDAPGDSPLQRLARQEVTRLESK